MSHRIALIDADVLMYRSGFAVESKVITQDEIDGEVWESVSIEAEPVENAIAICRDTLEYILMELATDDYELYLTGDTNFRKEIATVKKYKGNRDNARRPIYADALRKYLIADWNAKVTAGQEADDELGIRLTETGETGIICTIDKDLLMVPGKHYNWVNGNKKITNEFHGMQYFYRQLLCGDNTDNIPGCPSVGAKRSAKILRGLDNEVDLWNACLETYDKQLTKLAHKVANDFHYENGNVCYRHWETKEEINRTLEEYLTEIANLLWIRRERNKEWQIPG